jgi:hypothetical protein
MNQMVFKQGLEKSILSEILAWSQHSLEKPNAFFNNLPACPFAKKAWKEGKVAVLFKHEKNYQTVYSTISQFDTVFDLVIVVDLAYEKNSDLFHEYLEKLNEAISAGMFIDKDIWVMGFHPDDEEAEYLDTEDFEQVVNNDYAMIFIQRLSKIYDSSTNLKALGYYEEYDKEYDIETIFDQRTKLYRRLTDGYET